MVYYLFKKTFQPEGLPQFLTTSKHNATYNTRKQIVCKKNFDIHVIRYDNTNNIKFQYFFLVGWVWSPIDQNPLPCHFLFKELFSVFKAGGLQNRVLSIGRCHHPIES